LAGLFALALFVPFLLVRLALAVSVPGLPRCCFKYFLNRRS
jgi:hypothetical protein